MIQGACYCRSIEYQTNAKPKFVAHCHCENCRRAHAAAFVTWMGFFKSDVLISDPKKCLTSYQTETLAQRSFCKNCGTMIFFESPRWAGDLHVACGSLDPKVEVPKPRANVYYDRHVPWLENFTDIMRLGGSTGMESLKPDSSKE